MHGGWFVNMIACMILANWLLWLWLLLAVKLLSSRYEVYDNQDPERGWKFVWGTRSLTAHKDTTAHAYKCSLHLRHVAVLYCWKCTHRQGREEGVQNTRKASTGRL